MHRSRGGLPVALVLSTVCLAARGVPAPQADTAPLTRAEIETFLQHAKIVGQHSLSKGTTKPTRLTLSDGTRTHDAVFQAIDVSAQRQRFSDGRVELNFRDSYRYNIAAYRVADLIGLGDMLPVTVERAWNGEHGSLSWWIEWKWDEQMRRKEEVSPPDDKRIAYTNQIHLSRLFEELVYDTDRNQTNTLISEDWQLYMVDFTRAFRRADAPAHLDRVQRCRRDVYEKLQALTRQTVEKAVGDHLEPAAVQGLLARRDKIVEHLRALIQERGEMSVLF
jgi:hypothetical protein